MSDRSLIGLLRRHHMWIPLMPVTMAMAVLLAGAVLDRTVDAFDGIAGQCHGSERPHR